MFNNGRLIYIILFLSQPINQTAAMIHNNAEYSWYGNVYIILTVKRSQKKQNVH